jgi:hypothetical protein
MSGDKFDGDNNIKAGGNVTINKPGNLRDDLEKRLDFIDKEINNVVRTVIAKTKKDAEEPFSSRRMFRSLISIGIDADVAIEVIENILPHFPKENEDITSNDIRRAVKISIYNLSPSKYPKNKLQAWGDNYVRRYGDSHRQINVLHGDDSTELLNFNYIKCQLIPNLVEEIIGAKLSSMSLVISSNNISSMSEVILEHVKSLNLLSIRYSTLLHLSVDLAIQPPHPWFSTKETSEKITEYDFGRASDHFGRMKELWNNKDIHNCWHSMQETIYHSCSMVLSYYRMFMGCSSIAPIQNLNNIVKALINKDNVSLWEETRISQIKGDLISTSINEHEFTRLLDNILKHYSNYTEESLEYLIDKSIELYELCTSLINKRLELDRIVQSPELHSDLECKNIVLQILMRIEVIKRHLPISGDQNNFWLVHNSRSAVFNEIKAKILISTICGHVVENEYELFERIKQSVDILEDNLGFSNTIIFVLASDDIDMIRHRIRQAGGRGFRAIVLSIKDASIICDSNNRPESFEDLILQK